MPRRLRTTYSMLGLNGRMPTSAPPPLPQPPQPDDEIYVYSDKANFEHALEISRQWDAR
jgi:hypothetical protein